MLSRVSGAQARQVLAAMKEYRGTLLPERQHILEQYRPIDVCFKVVGTGSVGTRDYCIYLEGNGPGDPLFLQIKEEVGSAYRPYVNDRKKAHWGRAVAEGQRAMQMQSDPFLGWTTIENRDYLVRQLNDHKASIEVEALKGAGLTAYAEVCGELLARGHARSGDVQMIVGYLGSGESFGEALVNFAVAYADQTEADWETLRKSQQCTWRGTDEKCGGEECERECSWRRCGTDPRGVGSSATEEPTTRSGVARLPWRLPAGREYCFPDECADAGPARIP